MTKVLVLFLLLIAFHANAQQVTGKVVDASTNKPLGYATIGFNHQRNLLYTDSSGRFIIPRDSLPEKDSIYIEYLGYKKLAFPVTRLVADNLFRLAPQSKELTPVVVANCRQYREITINKRVGRINEYIGPGPETKFIIMGRYLDAGDRRGYIKTIEIYAGKFNEAVHVPVRIHWYEWDSASGLPGGELTSSSIIVYPYKKNWNKFALPYNTIYYEKGGIVLGLEFIYPVEYMQQYIAITSSDEKGRWLMDMNNRWSVGTQTTTNADEAGFYLVNNLPIKKYNSRGRGQYIKPAIRFTVTECIE